MISEKNSKKKNLREHFWELLNGWNNRIWSVYRYCINSVYDLCKGSFFIFVF